MALLNTPWKLINCRQADGSLMTLEIKGEHIAAVVPQSGTIAQAEAKSLRDLGQYTHATPTAAPVVYPIIDVGGQTLLPAALDVHVHSRDPGLTHKETWSTLARGAWRGGVVAVCDMPNTKPPTMTEESVRAKAAIAAATGLDFGIYLGVGAGNIDRIAAILSDTSLPICGLKVYYGQSTGDLMYSDLEKLGAAMPKGDRCPMIVFHSEDQCCIDKNREHFLPSGKPLPNSKGDFRLHSAIRSSAAAHASTRTILKWAKSYGRPIHIAHLSTPVEAELIAEAKLAGVPVTSEVAPHHLLFSTDDYDRLGALIKINPPVRSPDEVRALRQLVRQGAIECFATDHAPHTLSEKSGDILSAPSGAPALELFWPLLARVAYDCEMPMAQAVSMGATSPARLFHFDKLGELSPGKLASFVWADHRKTPHFKISAQEVVSKCGWTPYDGMNVPMQVLATWHRGQLRYVNTEVAGA